MKSLLFLIAWSVTVTAHAVDTSSVLDPETFPTHPMYRAREAIKSEQFDKAVELLKQAEQKHSAECFCSACLSNSTALSNCSDLIASRARYIGCVGKVSGSKTLEVSTACAVTVTLHAIRKSKLFILDIEERLD